MKYKNKGLGMKVLVWCAFQTQFNIFFHTYLAYHRSPIVNAIWRKHRAHIREDINKIEDRSREFYLVDDSQPMAYSIDDLASIYSTHQGNQPDGDVQSSSCLTEVDNFLASKENNLTAHHKYVGGAEFIEKGFPTVTAAKDIMES